MPTLKRQSSGACGQMLNLRENIYIFNFSEHMLCIMFCETFHRFFLEIQVWGPHCHSSQVLFNFFLHLIYKVSS